MVQQQPYTRFINGQRQPLIDRITEQYLRDRTDLDDPPTFTEEAIDLIKFYMGPLLNRLERVTNKIMLFNFMRDLPSEFWNKINPKINVDNLGEAIPITMDMLIDSILIEENSEYFNGFDLVDPWDVIAQLRSNEIARGLFRLAPLTEEQNEGEAPITIVVDVTIHGQVYPLELSRDNVEGILTFYKELKLPHPLSLGGKGFNYEFNKIVPVANPLEFSEYGYTVSINNHVYAFYSMQYLQGLLTAASWVGVNPRDYLVDINKIEISASPPYFVRIPMTWE